MCQFVAGISIPELETPTSPNNLESVVLGSSVKSIQFCQTVLVLYCPESVVLEYVAKSNLDFLTGS